MYVNVRKFSAVSFTTPPLIARAVRTPIVPMVLLVGTGKVSALLVESGSRKVAPVTQTLVDLPNGAGSSKKVPPKSGLSAPPPRTERNPAATFWMITMCVTVFALVAAIATVCAVVYYRL